MSDLISRQDAVKEIDSFCGEVWTESEADFARGLGAALSIVESLPSAEQVTGKLNNPDDSLLTADSEACKEQKSKLDLISRQDAISAVWNHVTRDATTEELERLPSVQPSGDLISRESALAEFRDGRDVYDIMESIEELPSAETSTASEKHQLSEETSTNTSTDLISRQDAIDVLGEEPEIWNDTEEEWAYRNAWVEHISAINSLPSAESTGAMDEAIQEYIKDGYMQPIGEDLISRQAVIELIKNSYYNLAENMDDVWAMVHDVEQLPSAEVEDRLYIKIYADDEPSVMAEKLYQICGEKQNREVAEWLKEYFPSAPDSRQRGEWVRVEDELPEIKEHHVSETVWATTADGYVFTDELEENIFGGKCFACERITPYGEDNPNEVIAWKSVDVPEPYNCGADMRGEEE